MEIVGKNILITGGLGGFGLPLARELRNAGANVIIFDIKISDEFESYVVDVTCEEQIAKNLSQIERIDILINCAGEIYSEPFISFIKEGDKKHSRQNWNRVIDNNLTSVFNMSAAVGEKMVAKRTKGVIINFSSISAKGNAGQVAYSTAKAGIESMTKVMAKELGMFKIRVATIAPGFIDTPSTYSALSEDMIDYWIKKTPLRKMGTIEDIIKSVKFIITCDHLTGTTISVDGGLSI